MAKTTITVSSADPADGIVIAAPVNGAQFKPGTVTSLKATKADGTAVPAGTVVEFVVNGVVVGTVRQAPYSFTVKLSAGSKVLEARRFVAPPDPLPLPSDPPPVPVPGTPPELSKAVVGSADFRRLGAFRLPDGYDGLDGGWGSGLALRRVNGEVRFFSTVLSGQLYEVAKPALTADGSITASIVRKWGICTGTKASTNPRGLYWDEADKRLYWSFGHDYDSLATDPSLGYSTLNETTGAITAVGPWNFTPRGIKATMGGVLGIPTWFASAYCQGRRLGVGFGGYHSRATIGPVSMGPALCAIDPPTAPEGSALPFTGLVSYPFHAEPYTSPDRGHRDADYHTDYDGWQPQGSVGYWTWSDVLWQSAAWIDTPTKQGVVFLPTLGNGRVWYETSKGWAERGSHAFHVYSPADLAAVAKGEKAQDAIQPATRWRVQYPGVPYDTAGFLPGWQDTPPFAVTGTVFDPVDSILYVAVRFNAPKQHVVHAYQVTP